MLFRSETFAGKGSFVAARNTTFIREEHLRQMEEHLLTAIDLAKLAAMTKEDVMALINELYEEDAT